MRWYTVFWAVWIGIGLLFELGVLIFGVDDATLSEQVWKLRETGSGFFSLLIFFLAWMIYHFIRENVGVGDLPPLPTPGPGPDLPPAPPDG